MTKIGLEIHGYLNTKEKLFCKCKAIHGSKHAKPNTHICPICTGQPGSKPMLPNSQAIKHIIQIALILECKINEKFTWQRKHYDWPDLPKGYQNTISGPHAIPIGENGKFLGIRIREVHLEEDPAAWNPKTGEIDYNRSGSPLVEIVTEPDFSSSTQVIDWLKQLLTTLGYIKAIDKKAGIKADVNVSITGGERIEVKNINGLKKIQNAIEYEIKRQEKPGNLPRIQETRMYDDAKGITKLMRTKEQAEDYRFMADPDLPIIKLEKSRINKIKSALPETPQDKLEKMIKQYDINKKSAEILARQLEIAEFFEKIVHSTTQPKLAVRWVTEELLSVLNYNKKEFEDVDIKTEHFIELLKLLEKGTITELKAKEILRSWKEKSSSPKTIAKTSSTISNRSEIEKVVKEIVKENKKAVEDYKSGEQNALNFLIGKVMQKTNNRANYKTVRDILEDVIK